MASKARHDQKQNARTLSDCKACKTYSSVSCTAPVASASMSEARARNASSYLSRTSSRCSSRFLPIGSRNSRCSTFRMIPPRYRSGGQSFGKVPRWTLASNVEIPVKIVSIEYETSDRAILSFGSSIPNRANCVRKSSRRIGSMRQSRVVRATCSRLRSCRIHGLACSICGSMGSACMCISLNRRVKRLTPRHAQKAAPPSLMTASDLP